MKIWALDRLEELRSGTSKVKFSELEPVLIPLISDPSRDVRLNTARRLAVAGGTECGQAAAGPAECRAGRADPARDPGGPCGRRATWLPGHPGRKVPEEIRDGTLVWAVRFLNDADAEKARIGAEVIGKLLEQDGLKPEDVNGYLKALADRYAQMNPANDIGLRGYLLGAMAGLCSSRSACREQAAKQFGGFFEQALADKSRCRSDRSPSMGWSM